MHQRLDLAVQEVLFLRGQFLGSGNDNGNVGGFRAGAQGVDDRETVHLRHHQIEDDQVWQFALDQGQALDPIAGFADDVIPL